MRVDHDGLAVARARGCSLVCSDCGERAVTPAETKLVEAQKQLVACASVDCPKFVRADCLRWLDEVQATLPTIVVRANDPSGNDVLEGNVLIDGGPGAPLGSATPLDPGPHVLTVKRGTDTGELRVLVAEGEKNRVVVVKLDGGVTSGNSNSNSNNTRTVSSPSPTPTTTVPSAASEPHAPVSSGRGPAPWIAGGIGVAGLVAFGVLQVAAQDQYDSLKEKCAPKCDSSEVDGVRTKVTLSAVGSASVFSEWAPASRSGLRSIPAVARLGPHHDALR